MRIRCLLRIVAFAAPAVLAAAPRVARGQGFGLNDIGSCAVARAYATVAHAVVGAARKPRARVMDLWIASTALVHGVPLFTRNPSDFAGLASLIDVHTV